MPEPKCTFFSLFKKNKKKIYWELLTFCFENVPNQDIYIFIVDLDKYLITRPSKDQIFIIYFFLILVDAS